MEKVNDNDDLKKNGMKLKGYLNKKIKNLIVNECIYI